MNMLERIRLIFSNIGFNTIVDIGIVSLSRIYTYKRYEGKAVG